MLPFSVVKCHVPRRILDSKAPVLNFHYYKSRQNGYFFKSNVIDRYFTVPTFETVC